MAEIAIRPYITSKVNMGLEKYKQVLFEGTKHKYAIWAKDDIPGSNMFRHVTGLNEFAPELERLPKDVKEAKIKQIREKVSRIEQVNTGKSVKTTDKDFWDKITVATPTNVDFWGKIKVTVSNEPVFLDASEVNDLIIISAIEAGGFPDIAPSLEAARKKGTYKFYLDKFDDTAKMEATLGIVEDEAKAILLNLLLYLK